MTAEVAEGWLPILFIPEKARDVWGKALDAGNAKRDPALGPLRISAGGMVAIGDGDDVTGLRQLSRPNIALYVGGMGARGKNFYNELARRYGFEAEAAEIQDLYLAGRKDEAAAAVPEELLEKTTLCGPEGYVRERLAAYREAGVTHLQVAPVPTGGGTPVQVLERLRSLID
jgi:alkanesulfonate monooxygenase SsuD/methylene tetrahydromethanopterin reductase-like flavin-dependent oxidoreductase (luciferase family)